MLYDSIFSLSPFLPGLGILMQTLLGDTNHTINFAICNLPKGCKLFNVLTSAWVFLLKQEGFGFRSKWRDWSTSYTRAALSLFEPVNLPPVGVKNDPQPFGQVHLRVSLEASGLTPLRLFCFISSADSRVLKSFKTRSAWLVILGLFVNIHCIVWK